MITLPPIDRENDRIGMVRSFGLLDKPSPAQHEEIAAFARNLANTRWASVALVDSERVWLSGGADNLGSEQCRWASFCTHVVSGPNEPLWVEDARSDFRFALGPKVPNESQVRFYAGTPILVNGHAVGALCVFDTKPRPFDLRLTGQLRSLARIVAEDLAARHQSQSTRAALAASADALIDYDSTGQIVSWSNGAERLFGFSLVEAVGCNIDMIVPANQKAAHRRCIVDWQRSGFGRFERRMELTASKKDGSTVEIELWMSVVHRRGSPYIHANIRDISERKAHAHALEAARADAQAASEAKTIFLANMSHELRTPLNGVIGVVDLLAQTSLSEQQRELTDIIKSSSDQLGGLVGDILDLAQIESGQLALSQTEMCLEAIVGSVRNVCELAAQEKGLSLVIDTSLDTKASVIGDPIRVKQVLTNLVSNAVKFTERGSVAIAVSHAGDHYRFEVSDTGIGFDESQRKVIFGRFQQADGTITRRFGGSGLGLAISRELVAAMGGKIDCRSTLGQGATFWFTLPLAQAHPPGSRDDDEARPPLSMGRVLVVDDHATNRRVAELLLQTIGIEVVFAEDGDQAVEAFLTDRFDAVLMDMMMPIMDGTTATTAIRDIERRDGLPRTPIIMLTANSLPQHIEASLESGADLHLPKPMNAASLYEALSKVQGATEPGLQSQSYPERAEDGRANQ